MEQTKRIKIALDTNMLLAIQKLKIDVFSQIKELMGRVEFVAPKQVKKELEEIKKRGIKLRKGVLLAEKLMEKNEVKEIEIEGDTADQALLNLSQNCVVASNDKELLKKIRGKKIFIRKKKFIEMN